jgi:hypothetical protein
MSYDSSDNTISSLRNGRVLIGGVQYGSTATLNEVDSASAYTQYTVNYTVTPGTPVLVELRADIYDNDGTDNFAITSEWLSNWINLTPSKTNLQGVFGIAVEGFIWAGTEEITFSLYKDYNTDASYSFTFGIDDADFLDDSIGLGGYFGGLPLGTSPIGSLGAVASDGSRHFQFLLYFPFIYGNFFSVGLANDETTAKFDVTRFGLALSEEPEHASTRILTN